MLFKISMANIKKSFKDYTVYFFTLILGVAIFYVFNAIESQTVLLNVTENTMEIIDLLTNTLSGVSVFVSFVLGFLIIYASIFLIKRRKREFGIYLTLGMSKRKISLILFTETMLIGVLSLAVGILVGVAASQLMSVLVADMFNADMTKFSFVFSENACKKTIVYFVMMYAIVMIFNTVSVNKCKLIDLLHGDKKAEQIRLKNPAVCIIVFLLSVIVLGRAYYMVTAGFEDLQFANQILIPIAMGAVSTFFIFWSLSGLLLKIVMSAKKRYYKGLNSFTLRQFSSKVNTTVFSMTVICLMLFITICLLSSCLNLKKSMEKNISLLAPADIMISKRIHMDASDKADGYSDEAIKASAYGVFEEYRQKGVDLKSYFKEMVELNIYKSDALTYGDTLGSMREEIEKQFPFLQYDEKEKIVKISDYNKVAELYGIKTYSLKDNEYMVIADFQSMEDVRNIALYANEPIHVFGKTLTPKYKSCQDGFIDLSSQHINDGIFLLPDSVVEEDSRTHDVIIANYKADDKKERQETEKEILSMVYDGSNQNITVNSKIDITEASVGLGAMVTFIGIYLGMVFLISGAAVLALKELSESADNKERFCMLRKIGADEKMINRALFCQIGIFFALPLLLAMIHSIFGMVFAVKILEIFGTEQLLPSILMTSLFIIVIYGGYFLLTYACSKNIIKEK